MSEPFACCVVVENEHGQILAVSRRNRPDTVGFPGGKMAPGEGPAACACRELREETGIVTDRLRFLHEGTDGEGHVVWAYQAMSWQGPIKQNEAGISPQWISWEDMTSPLKTPWPDYNRAVRQAFFS